MDFQASYTGLTLVVQAGDTSITSFADNSTIHRQVVNGLHHIANIVLSWRAVCGDGSSA